MPEKLTVIDLLTNLRLDMATMLAWQEEFRLRHAENTGKINTVELRFHELDLKIKALELAVISLEQATREQKQLQTDLVEKDQARSTLEIRQSANNDFRLSLISKLMWVGLGLAGSLILTLLQYLLK